MKSQLALSDPGGARPIVSRWVITADVVLRTAAHFGGEAGDAVDMMILRDAVDNVPLLTGSSMAGALRSHLADKLTGYLKSEEEGRDVAHLFGASRLSDNGWQSPLIVFDSLGALPEHCTVEIRDGVQINSQLGVAADHMKYDYEVLPADTRFPLRLDLIVPSAEEEGELLSLLINCLSGFNTGDIRLGMRRSRGLGEANAENWRALRYDLSCRSGWIDWLKTEPAAKPTTDVPGSADPITACRRAWPPFKAEAVPDTRKRISVVADLCSSGGLFVRSAPTGPDSPDAVHILSANRSVLPGTSLAGALRARALRIAQVVRRRHGDADRWVDSLFGPQLSDGSNASQTAARSSRIGISESIVDGGVRMRPSRIRIDRFTQGVIGSALFDEEPEYNARTRISIELRNPIPGECGLLVLLLKDLLDGDLAVGGASSIGRGVFTGSASLTFEDGSTVRLYPSSHAEESVEKAIGEFWECGTHGGAS